MTAIGAPGPDSDLDALIAAVRAELGATDPITQGDTYNLVRHS